MSARKQFDTAYRAHRAWKTRRISHSEYDAATGRRSGMPGVHAESVHKAWRTDTPQRLTWRRDSAGRLDAYLGSGSSVTVMPAPRWMFENGPLASRLTGGPWFVAVVDRMGIGGSPKYLDARGTSEYGTVTGRSITFPSEAKAKAAASRYLLRLHRALAGKSVGQKLPRGNPSTFRSPTTRVPTHAAVLPYSHPLVREARRLGLEVAQQSYRHTRAIGCPKCDASGFAGGKPCATCGNTGYLRFRAPKGSVLKRKRNPASPPYSPARRPSSRSAPRLESALASARYVQQDAGEALAIAIAEGDMARVRKYAAQIDRARQDERDLLAALEEVGARAKGHWIASRDRHAREWYQSDFRHAKVVGDRAGGVLRRYRSNPSASDYRVTVRYPSGKVREYRSGHRMFGDPKPSEIAMDEARHSANGTIVEVRESGVSGGPALVYRYAVVGYGSVQPRKGR